MTNQSEIKKILNPKSIALIGASNDPKKAGGVLVSKLKKFKGNIFHINKEADKIAGKISMRSILNCKKEIDLAIISVPAKESIKIVKQCIKKEIKNILIVPSGFLERKNLRLRKKLWKLIQKYNLNIIGPNSFGIFNSKKLDATFSNKTSKKGNTAIISQNGALWSYLSDLDIGFSSYVGLGNMDGLDFADFIEYFEKDRSTTKIICYIEKLREAKRFIEVCKNSKKEIIVVKGGRTERGRKSTINNTGIPSTDYEIYKGIFKQAGVKIKNSLSLAREIKKQEIRKILKKKNISIITNSGGAATILTDELTEKNFTVEKIVNVTKMAKPFDYRRALNKFTRYDGELLVIVTPQKMTDLEGIAYLISTHPTKEKIKAIFLGEKSLKEIEKILKKNKIPLSTRVI